MIDRVVIGAHTHSIHFVEKCSKKRRVGEADMVRNTISLRDDQAASQLRSTLLHEIIHHALYASATQHVEGWTKEIEEAVCCSLEGPLLELFARPENGPVRDWLGS